MMSQLYITVSLMTFTQKQRVCVIIFRSKRVTSDAYIHNDKQEKYRYSDILQWLAMRSFKDQHSFKVTVCLYAISNPHSWRIKNILIKYQSLCTENRIYGTLNQRWNYGPKSWGPRWPPTLKMWDHTKNSEQFCDLCTCTCLWVGAFLIEQVNIHQ